MNLLTKLLIKGNKIYKFNVLYKYDVKINFLDKFF